MGADSLVEIRNWGGRPRGLKFLKVRPRRDFLRNSSDFLSFSATFGSQFGFVLDWVHA